MFQKAVSEVDMPAAYAHYVFGNRIIENLGDDMKLLIEGNRELFDIGLQGPDIFFYNYAPIRGRRINKLGRIMHRRPGSETLAPMIVNARRMAGSTRDRVNKAPTDMDEHWSAAEYGDTVIYLMGFLAHYTLDRNAHPYVQKIIDVTGIPHSTIEGSLDRALMVADGKDPVAYRYIDHIMINSYENSSVIASLINGVSEVDVYRSIKDTIFLHRLLHAPTAAKRKVLFASMKAIGQYNKLKGHVTMPEADPSLAGSDKQLIMIMDEAARDYAVLLDQMMTSIRTSVPLGDDFDRTFRAGDRWQEIEL